MERKVTITKSVGDSRLNDVVDREVKMKNPRVFLHQLLKLADKNGWELETVDLMFVRENKDGDWRSDTLFINTSQL